MGSETRDLSAQEILNRDYYRGRFASIDNNGNYIYNWEEKIFNLFYFFLFYPIN